MATLSQNIPHEVGSLEIWNTPHQEAIMRIPNDMIQIDFLYSSN